MPKRRCRRAGQCLRRCLRFGVSSGRGFAGAGRVHPARPFILSSFLSRRKSEGHEGPRSVAVLHHRKLTEHIIGLAIEVHRHSRIAGFVLCHRAMSGAGACWHSGTAQSRHSGDVIKANLCRLDSGPISLWTKPLSWKLKRSRRCWLPMTCDCRPICA
jgi:hypothetical protein